MNKCHQVCRSSMKFDEKRIEAFEVCLLENDKTSSVEQFTNKNALENITQL